MGIPKLAEATHEFELAARFARYVRTTDGAAVKAALKPYFPEIAVMFDWLAFPQGGAMDSIAKVAGITTDEVRTRIRDFAETLPQ
ncbi:MAG: hypothetical protein WBA15_04330 [Mesorhizobium sp.]